MEMPWFYVVSGAYSEIASVSLVSRDNPVLIQYYRRHDVVDVFMKQLSPSSLPTHRGCHVSRPRETDSVYLTVARGVRERERVRRVYAPRRCQKTLRRVPPLSINTGGRGPTALRAARSQSSTQKHLLRTSPMPCAEPEDTALWSRVIYTQFSRASTADP